jgi:hypothetical protein
MTLVLNLEIENSPRKEKAELGLLEDIEILLQYLAIGKGQGWINDINFLIIAKEYYALKETVRNLPKRAVLQSHLDERQLPVDEVGEAKRVVIAKNPKVPENRQYIQKQDTASSKALARHEKILEVLHRKEKAQVADFIKELPKITKRTIRRDLDDLLKKDQIIRIGKWNQVVYALAK